MGWFWLQGLSWTRERRRGFASAFFPCPSGKVEYHIVVKIGGLFAKRRSFAQGQAGISCGVARRYLPGRPGAFTLIELLVATAVFMILVVVLTSVANQAASVWSRNESRSDAREAARAAMARMESEMRQAVLPLDADSQTSLQFVVNPAGINSQFKNRDAIFWQAPVATTTGGGDLAIVGYFVRRSGNTSTLCRLLVNPDDPDYAVGSETWVSDALLDAKAPGTNLQGVFLENVLGMWVTAYSDATTPYAADYDSRTAHQFPARVEISLALLDRVGAKRIAGGIALPNPNSSPGVASFLTGLPDALREHVSSVTINVSFSR